MPFVLDASLALAAISFDGPDQVVETLPALLRVDGAVVPAVFLPEVLHVLVKAERRARGISTLLDRQVRALQDMAVTTDMATGYYLQSHSLPLARTHRLSIFDATYLELAKRLSLPLATFDNGLIRAAQAERIPLLP